jgi:hypothetical protein
MSFIQSPGAHVPNLTLEDVCAIMERQGWDRGEMRKRLNVADHVPAEADYAIEVISRGSDTWPMQHLQRLFCDNKSEKVIEFWKRIAVVFFKGDPSKRGYLSAFLADIYSVLGAGAYIETAARGVIGTTQTKASPRIARLAEIARVINQGKKYVAALEAIAKQPLFELSALENHPALNNQIAAYVGESKRLFQSLQSVGEDDRHPNLWLSEAILRKLTQNRGSPDTSMLIRVVTEFCMLLTGQKHLSLAVMVVGFFFPDYRCDDADLKKTISKVARVRWLDPVSERLTLTPTGMQLLLKEPPVGMSGGLHIKSPIANSSSRL